MLALAEIAAGPCFCIFAAGILEQDGRFNVPYLRFRANVQQNPLDAEEIERILDRTRTHGPPFNSGKARSLRGTGLYEFRARHGVRVFWIYGPGRAVILLTAYHKRGRVLPRRELQRAQRWQSLIHLESNARRLSFTTFNRWPVGHR